MKTRWLSLVVLGFVGFAGAETQDAQTCSAAYGRAQAVLLRDIGVMGLASHDLFAWNRKKKVNRENGRLDLSTIFESGKKGDLLGGDDWWKNARIEKAGNKKNSENAPVYTVAMGLVDRYQSSVIGGKTPTEARKALVREWHAMVKASFERLTQLAWPEPAQGGTVNNQEQAAMRILHDILPGNVRTDEGGTFCVTNAKTAKTRLSDHEMDQELNAFDGDYDAEYNDIQIPFLGFKIHLDLENIDANFIRYAGLDPVATRQELHEVGLGQREMQDTSFGRHLTALFAKGQAALNQDGSANPWTSQ